MFWPAASDERKRFLEKYDEMDSVFGNLLGDFSVAFGDCQYQNKDGDLIREIDCPGFNKENLKIELSDGIVSIKGERKDGEGVDRKIYKRYRVGTYEIVDAEIKDGILYLTFKTPQEKKKTINIK